MKLKIKESRDKRIGIAFIALSSLFVFSTLGNVLTGSLAWHFYKTRETIVTPMVYIPSLAVANGHATQI